MTNTDEKFCVQKTLKIIGSKWTVLILRELCDGTKRFGELEKNLEGISSKTLSIRLKELEKNGILKKKIYPTIPPKAEYTLTPKGQSLKSIISSMHEWGEHYT
jgi:DNA-binding HxlR family transcriptional regulator